ncbi:hypothetical protein ACWDZ6_21765 [Streptomyces sp. NPDC002926]
MAARTRAVGLHKERRQAPSPNTPTLLAREVQRIEQGMGRGVRDSEDHCAVLLLGGNVGVATHDPLHLVLFSPATRAQLTLSGTSLSRSTTRA